MIGTAPYRFIAEHYDRPLVIAGFEPLDILQSLWMVLRQIAEGRCEIENQYRRVVPDDGNGAALDAVARVFELREFFEWRGLGSIDHSGVRHARGLRRASMPSASSPCPTLRIADPEILPVRRGAEGRHQALAVQGLRHRLHAGDAARCADGLLRGRLRRLLPIWRRAPAADRAAGGRAA